MTDSKYVTTELVATARERLASGKTLTKGDAEALLAALEAMMAAQTAADTGNSLVVVPPAEMAVQHSRVVRALEDRGIVVSSENGRDWHWRYLSATGVAQSSGDAFLQALHRAWPLFERQEQALTCPKCEAAYKAEVVDMDSDFACTNPRCGYTDRARLFWARAHQ